MEIGFYDHGIGFRGTTRAILQYARCIKEIYGYNASFFFKKTLENNNVSFGINLLKENIKISPIETEAEIIESGVDMLYHVTSSDQSGYRWLKDFRGKSLLHQVGFQRPDYETPNLFAYTGFWQSYYFTGNRANVLPYLIEPQKNDGKISSLKEELDIPDNAVVLGRHGGFDTWNLPFVNDVIKQVVRERADIYFLFMNTPKFINHPQVIFIDGTHEDKRITQFLSTCDAMIHSRWEGETFGLACAEFLINKKPIITWAESRERNHIFMADKSVITYNLGTDLYSLLMGISKDYIAHKSAQIPLDWIIYHHSSDYAKGILDKLFDDRY